MRGPFEVNGTGRGEESMASLATEQDILTVPKVELHIHLNGSITEATAATLARRHGADPTRP